MFRRAKSGKTGRVPRENRLEMGILLIQEEKAEWTYLFPRAPCIIIPTLAGVCPPPEDKERVSRLSLVRSWSSVSHLFASQLPSTQEVSAAAPAIFGWERSRLTHSGCANVPLPPSAGSPSIFCGLLDRVFSLHRGAALRKGNP
ncbi:MAG: hypothetical protein U0793_28380 [Gemmataceae bacterium]